MSTGTLAPLSVPAPPPAAPPAPAKPAKPWLVGPLFDLLCVANLGWPIVVLLLTLDGTPWAAGPLSALQVYFLSTPHRWITLALVFLDREHFWQQPRKFGGLAALLIGLGLALVAIGALWKGAAESLVPLMMLDYVWNSWHFASQHAGIARIYGRMTRPNQTAKSAEFEKSAVRMFVLWVFVRLALYVARLKGAGGDALETLWPALEWLDPVALAPVLWVLIKEVLDWRPQCRGRLAYLVSVTAIYAVQLLAIRAGQRNLMYAVFLAGAVFHAAEYLAIVSWSVRRKTAGIWGYLAPRLGLVVVAFMAVMGCAHYLIEARFLYAWMLVTLLVSLLHYGYDGIIWKSRPKPAAKTAG
jgi:hypothetical protein